MATSPDVAKARFSRFIARVLGDARDRGMTDEDIERATGVGASTFHRWRRGGYKKAPDLDRVTALCTGLGVSPRDALAALGVNGARDNPTPEPPLDPDVRTILRALSSPDVPDADKLLIREMLAMLAARARRSGRVGGGTGERREAS